VLEFMGRSDRQVKVRGFRIELDEIEATLLKHPAVQQAVVKLRDESARDKQQLVAYIVAQPGVPVQECELLSFLSSKLPQHMLPSTITRLETMPLTANGKVDRRALPDPDLHTSLRGVGESSPRSPVEQLLSEIWEQLLGIKSVSTHDNFFGLGGHSLLATQLVSRVRNTFGVEISLRSVFETSTLEQMASVIRELQLRHAYPVWKPSGKSLVVIQPNGSKPPFFCVHGFEGYARLAAYLGPDQPMYGLDQALDANRFITRVEELAAHYIRDIKRICPQGPYFLGGHSFGGLVAFEMAQQLREAGEEIGLLVLIDPTTPTHADQRLSSAVGICDSQKHSSSERFGSRILRHLRHLQELPRGTRARYVRQCFVMMLTGMILTPLSKKSKRLTCKICLQLGWTMPSPLRAFFIREVLYSGVYRAASKAYQPKRYYGRAALILAEQKGKFDPKVIWTALIPNGLTNYTVPGDHNGIVLEPQVGILAGHLRNCLNQAQQTLLATKSARPASTRDNIIEFETAYAFERH
jgi:thioesterase domain-containing protein/acyl carrier protein